MITKIITIQDVKDFAKQLTAEGVSFHPDDDFKEYINFSSNEPIYSIEDAEFRNNLMNDCFEVCENPTEPIDTLRKNTLESSIILFIRE